MTIKDKKTGVEEALWQVEMILPQIFTKSTSIHIFPDFTTTKTSLTYSIVSVSFNLAAQTNSNPLFLLFQQPHKIPPKDRRYLHRPFSKGTEKSTDKVSITIHGTVMSNLSDISNSEISLRPYDTQQAYAPNIRLLKHQLNCFLAQHCAPSRVAFLFLCSKPCCSFYCSTR